MILSNSNNNVDQDLLRDQQYRKELSIAYFNALNNVITFVGLKKKTGYTEKQMLEDVSRIRDQFIEEYKIYRVTTLSKQAEKSLPDNPKLIESLNKLKQANESLQGVTPGDGGVV